MKRSGISAPHSTPLKPAAGREQGTNSLTRHVSSIGLPTDAAAEKRSRKGLSLKRKEMLTASLVAMSHVR